MCLGTSVGLRLTDVKVVNVVVKNSLVVSFEHPLTMAIVKRSESYWISINSDILFIEENFDKLGTLVFSGLFFVRI